MEYVKAMEILQKHMAEYRDSFGLFGKDFMYRVYSHVVESMILENKKGGK